MKSLQLILTAVTVVTGSVIIESPQSTKVSKGSPISLSCRVDQDFGGHQIRWYKNGNVLDTAHTLHRYGT